MAAMAQITQDIYPVDEWDSYADLFAAVTTSVQLEVYREACLHMKGNVVDCGCGAAKFAPFLIDRPEVLSYTGIDFSDEMIKVAGGTLKKLQHPGFVIRHAKIEEVTDKQFSSAVSIQSYYSWPEPVKTLEHIFELLTLNATFILATPNKDLPLELLARDAWQELLTHPHFEAYKAYNLKLATNTSANFVSMDKLIEQVRQVGFQVRECHQHHFRGGLNFLVLDKKA